MWITAKFSSWCKECRVPIAEGDKLFFDPGPPKAAYCEECGKELDTDNSAPKVKAKVKDKPASRQQAVRRTRHGIRS